MCKVGRVSRVCKVGRVGRVCRVGKVGRVGRVHKVHSKVKVSIKIALMWAWECT